MKLASMAFEISVGNYRKVTAKHFATCHRNDRWKEGLLLLRLSQRCRDQPEKVRETTRKASYKVKADALGHGILSPEGNCIQRNVISDFETCKRCKLLI